MCILERIAKHLEAKSVIMHYRMDLNFRGTKLSRIENFRVFRVFIFADARPTISY